MITAVPAVMKIKTDSDVLVSSLMMNYVVVLFASYILNYFLRDPKAGAVVSYAIPKTTQFASIVKGTKIHIGLIIAIAVAILVYVFLYKTKIGYEIRVTGENAEFAKYSGINVLKVTLISRRCGVSGNVQPFLMDVFSWVWLGCCNYNNSGKEEPSVCSVCRIVPCISENRGIHDVHSYKCSYRNSYGNTRNYNFISCCRTILK